MKKRSNKKVLAWHFLAEDRRLGYGDGRLVEVGKTYSFGGVPKLCEGGMHASTRALDCIAYAPGPIACLVELSGEMDVGYDKIAAQHRKVIAMADATKVLHLFACRVAKDALDAEVVAGRAPDPRSYAAIEAKHRYLNGEIDASALSAAWIAALSAAWSAAESAARNAAESAARSAARNAAESAAWSAAKEKQNALLSEMLLQLLINPKGELK